MLLLVFFFLACVALIALITDSGYEEIPEEFDGIPEIANWKYRYHIYDSIRLHLT
jgi:hypothetical protein